MLRIYSPEDRVPVAGVRASVLRIRKAKNITQGQLASLLRIPRKQIERIEQSAVETVDKELVAKIKELE